MYDFGNSEECCELCRNSGVFPGDAGWAYCLCAAGYERACSGVDDLKREFKLEDTAILAYFFELERRCFCEESEEVTNRTDQDFREEDELHALIALRAAG